MKRSNRRLAALSMAAIMAASVTACQSKPAETTAAPEEPTTAAESTAPAAAEGGAYTAGTYSASEQGFGGPVTVTITTSDSEITDVAIEGADETPGVGGAAFEPLQQAILDTQSAEIDAVSGATITSDAVKKAAANAIAQAKGEASADAGAELAFTAGTYTGTADGYNGPVEVSVTFDDKAVTAIEVTASGETEHVGDIAYDILIPQMIEANGTGVDSVSGATFSSRALKEAVNAAAEEAGVTNASQFSSNTVEVKAQDPIEDTWDVVIVGAGGAGISAAAQAAQDGNTVLVIEKNAEIGGNTLVSGGQYQSVMPYLVWDEKDPDATTGVGFDGNTYNKVKSVNGCIKELEMIYNWSEEEFDADYYKDHEYVAGDAAELSKHGVHADYLPTLQALKKEIKAYLDWAKPQLEAGKPESELTLFSTLNLHIFQTYYGGLRQSADGSEWVYGNVDLVKQFIEDGQDIKPWLESMGATFVEDTQPTLIGALWYRENEFIGANVDADGDGTPEEYKGRWGTYFMAPLTDCLQKDEKNQIMTRTTAEELIVEDGRVTGVKATMYDGTEVTAKANKGVILATGGYAANIKKVVETNKYWSPEFVTEAIKTTNRNSLTGSGIDMAQEVGAAVTGEGWTQMMPISWVDNGNLAFGGGNYAVYINPTTGKRFVDEGSERDVLSLGEFENGIEVNGTKGVFMEIYNASEMIPGPIQLAPEGDYEGRYYRRDANEEELAALFKEIGVTADAKTVLETIEKYDMAVMGQGEFEDVGKAIASRTIGDVEKNDDGSYNVDSYKLEGTALSIRLMAPSTHHTMGGVVVDTDRHVLDEEGNVIEGLYAAGEVTGGIHGGNRLGGNAITEIIVSGRTAAKAITADNK
ncbi:MAG: FAD-dependent oxidoreductase [Lachnospiraceae bacterium]|nr:FAD-dependent oxidoreductase [Lachnospiraceae bacterium]